MSHHSTITKISHLISIHHVASTINLIVFPNLYIFLFIFILLEELGIPMPLPGEFFVFLAGFRIAQGKAESYIIVLLIFIATFIGASILYAIIYRGGLPFIEKYGKYFFMSKKKIEKVQSWFVDHETGAVIAGRWVFGLRIVSNVIGGLFRFPYKKFISATLFATLIWSIFYIILGMIFGRFYLYLISFLGHFNGIIIEGAYLIFLSLITFLFIYITKRISEKSKNG